MTNTTSLNSTGNVDFLNNQLNYSNLGDMIEQEEKRRKLFNIFQKTITYLFLSFMALIIIFPFYWMLNTALKSATEVEAIFPTFFPEEIMWSNFYDAMTTGSSSFFKLLFNTVFVGVISTIGTVIITVLAAFAFARLEFKGKEALFGAFLATMMIPGEMLVITNFITVSELGLLNTYTVLIVPFMVSVFYIFLLRQNFKQIPNELYYAAKVDGTSDIKYLTKVMIPLAKPTIITIAILNLMGAWNSYVWPSIVNDSNMRMISNWVRTAFTDSEDGRTMLHLQMMASIIVTVPLIFVYVFLKKYIMQGVSRSGIKG